MNRSNEDQSARIERLVAEFDLLIDSPSDSMDTANLSELSDEEILELNRRLHCLELLDAVRWADTRPSPDGLDTSPSLPRDPSLPESIGEYQIEGMLGRGGHAQVYRALDPRIQRQVAIKVPHLEATASPEVRDRFQREATAAAMLAHPNLVPLFQSVFDGDTNYLVYGLARGPTLGEWLINLPQPSGPEAAATLVATLADAVQHAHTKGVIHRDLKPANILFWETPAPNANQEDLAELLCISDFGLARFPQQDQTMTSAGDILGTPAYMSPEQARGKSHTTDERADIYSLGIILYELLTGKPPHRRDTPFQTLRAVETEPVAWPADLFVPRDLQAIVLKCLEKEPGDRYGNAQQLADDLRCYLRGEPVSVRIPHAVERFRKWCHREPTTAVLTTSLIISLVVGLIGTLAFAIRSSRNAQQAADNLATSRAEASRATESEKKLRKQTEHTQLLLEKERRTNYALQIRDAFRLAYRRSQKNAQEILDSCPLKYRGIEHRLTAALNGNRSGRLSPSSPIRFATFDHQNHLLLTIHEDGAVNMRDLTDLRQERAARVLSLPESTISAVLSRDGKRLASLTMAKQEMTVQVQQLDGKVIAKRTFRDGGIRFTMAFAPDSKSLFMVTSQKTGREGYLLHWKFDGQDELDVVKSFPNPCQELRLSPDGQRLALSTSKQLLVLTLPDFKVLFAEKFYVARSLRFTSNHRLLLTHDSNKYAILNAKDGVVIAEGKAPLDPRIREIPETHQWLTWADTGLLRFHHPADASSPELRLPSDVLVACDFVPSQTTLVCVTRNEILFMDYSQPHLHQARKLDTNISTLRSGEAPNTLLISGKRDRFTTQTSFYRYDWVTGETLATVDVAERPGLPDMRGNTIWVAGATPRVFHETGRELPRPNSDGSPLRQVCWCESSQRLYGCGIFGICFWQRDAQGWSERQLLATPKTKGFPSFMALHEASHTIACGLVTGAVVMVDCDSGEVQWEHHYLPNAPKSVVSCLSFSPDGKNLLINYSAQQVVLVDVDDGSLQHRFESAGQVARFSRDGRRIAMVRRQPPKAHQIVVVDASTHEEIAAFQSHVSFVTDICFSHDDRYLFSGSGEFDHPLQIWALPR